MTKLALVLFLFSIGIAIPLLHSIKEVDEWIQKLHHAKESLWPIFGFFENCYYEIHLKSLEILQRIGF